MIRLFYYSARRKMVMRPIHEKYSFLFAILYILGFLILILSRLHFTLTGDKRKECGNES